MQLEDQLRAALRRDAAELQPVGPGPDHARRRAHRRKRRMQSGVLAASAAVLVGGTLAEIGTRSSSGGPRVAAQPTDSQPTPDLAWRSVDGTVLDQYSPKTNSDGVTYALSTAPGFIGPITNTTPQELYASRDGVSWTHTSLGAAPWLADLAPGDNGVLYAVGTGPSSQVGANDYRLKTSSNSGAQWDDTPIPVQLATPHASVKLQPTTSVHVARGSHATVVAVQASYSLDLTAPTGDLQSYRTTDTGVEILDFSACNKNKPTTVTVDG
ncbi:MAG TPA: hypothetical protein VGP92_04340, partial [Acidimicrobiia bacterium]|nr:hypothetical protein [Acidimicrobiia bacterium]